MFNILSSSGGSFESVAFSFVLPAEVVVCPSPQQLFSDQAPAGSHLFTDTISIFSGLVFRPDSFASRRFCL